MSRFLFSKKFAGVFFAGFSAAVLLLSYQNCSSGFQVMQSDQAFSTDTFAATPQGKIGLSVSDVSAKQSSELEFEITLQSPQSQPVTISYEAVSDTALVSTDFMATQASITIPAGSVSATVKVPTLIYEYAVTSKSLKLNVTATMGTEVERQTGTGNIEPSFKIPKFKKIAASADHVCGILLDGEVMCWGANGKGQLGSSQSGSIVPGLSGAKDVGVGAAHSCVLTADDTVRCWGSWVAGQNPSTEMDISGLSNVKALSVGQTSSCVITSDDKVKCWGSNYGAALGNGTKIDSLIPVEVLNLSNVKQVSVGWDSACALTSMGTVKCWGTTQLNEYTFETLLTPVEIPNLSNIKSVAVGSDTTCALSASGEPTCWGLAIEKQPLVLSGLSEVQVGLGASCAKSQSSLICWGRNNRYFMGASVLTESKITPTVIREYEGLKEFSLTSSSLCAIMADDTVKCSGRLPWGDYQSFSSTLFAEVKDYVGFKDISKGAPHSCAINSSNQAVCWGENENGELGNNSKVYSPIPVMVSNLGSVKKISVGRSHTCAITFAGTVKCWGSNGGGRLGNNSTVSSSTPVDAVDLSGVSDLVTGYGATCALTDQKKVKCWGDGILVPTEVANVSDVKQIVMRPWAGHTCVLTMAGRVKCWGANNFGQSGVPPTPTYDGVREAVDLGLSEIRSIAVGSYHSCAVTALGQVKCWGYNYSGQLGNDTKISSSVPVDVVGLTNVLDLSLKGEESCARDSQKLLHCWGISQTVPAPRFAGKQFNSVNVEENIYVDIYGRIRSIGATSDYAFMPRLFYMPL